MFSLQFAPDLVIVAAGFDAEKTDSLVSCPVYFATEYRIVSCI